MIFLLIFLPPWERSGSGFIAGAPIDYDEIRLTYPDFNLLRLFLSFQRKDHFEQTVFIVG
jgi:hypothetical protein